MKNKVTVDDINEFCDLVDIKKPFFIKLDDDEEDLRNLYLFSTGDIIKDNNNSLYSWTCLCRVKRKTKISTCIFLHKHLDRGILNSIEFKIREQYKKYLALIGKDFLIK